MAELDPVRSIMLSRSASLMPFEPASARRMEFYHARSLPQAQNRMVASRCVGIRLRVACGPEQGTHCAELQHPHELARPEL